MFIAEQATGLNWVEAAPKVQTQVNARRSEPRKNSPFFLMYGFNPKLAASPLPHSIPIYANPTKLYYQLGKNLTEAKLNQITLANKHRRPATPYEEGELVMVSTKNFPSHFNINKLHDPWIGPVPVIKANNIRQTYNLDLSDYPELSRITPTFHTSLIKPYQPNDDNKFPTRKLGQPGPVEKGRYEVEEVVEFRTEPRTGKRQYRVRWKAYNKSKDQWVYVEDIDKSLVEKYWKEEDQSATYRKREGKKDGTGKTRLQVVSMIRQERERILKEANQPQITTLASYLKDTPSKSFCKFCKYTGHTHHNCQRAPWIVRENNDCCFRCLQKGHTEANCHTNILYWYCKSSLHNTFTCPEYHLSNNSDHYYQNHPIYHQHYIDVSAIGEDGCTSQIIFHSNARECEVPKEWREKELKDGEFRYNPESIIQKKGKYRMILDLKEGYLG